LASRPPSASIGWASTRSIGSRRSVTHSARRLGYAWAGTFATTNDSLPFIGKLPGYPGVWAALGYGGNGITFSVVAATILRDAWIGQPHPDAKLFDFSRHERLHDEDVKE
jgi:glycine/D-amino acid oxidase-like deaminating enzyme